MDKNRRINIQKNEYIEVYFMLMLKSKYCLCLLSLLLCFSVKAQTIRFFVSAHQDDWQLFMNPNVYNSIKQTNDTTVIIHTTAGEAGAKMGNDAYYLAREKGSLAAIRFLSNTFSSGKGMWQEMDRSIVKINEHNILRYAYRNTVVYLLRLPDGNSDGWGYQIHDFKSLSKFFRGEVEELSTIDQSTIYKDKEDLILTLKDLIITEAKNQSIEIHLADTDTSIDLNDHSDHQTSSLFFQAAAKEIGGIQLFHYINYATGELPQNVTGDEFLVWAGAWGVTTAHIADHRHYSTWDSIHNNWIGRQYFRKTLLPKNNHAPFLPPTSSATHHRWKYCTCFRIDQYDRKKRRGRHRKMGRVFL